MAHAGFEYGLGALRRRQRAAAAEETIRHMAYFDPVTGLPNRVRVCQLLGDAIGAVHGKHRSLAFVRIGMAHLQELNEMLDSTEVDKLVQAVAGRKGRGEANLRESQHPCPAMLAIQVMPGRIR